MHISCLINNTILGQIIECDLPDTQFGTPTFVFIYLFLSIIIIALIRENILTALIYVRSSFLTHGHRQEYELVQPVQRTDDAEWQ